MNSSTSPRVVGKEGLTGQLETELLEAGTASNLVSIRLEDGRRMRIPRELLTPQADGSLLLPLTLRELEQRYGRSTKAEAEEQIVPVIAEDLQIETRTVETGRVRVQKTVQEQEEIVDPSLLRDNVTVVRVPIGRLCEGEAPGTRQEGDTMIIPVLEEVLVVEKRLMLKEEIHVRREQVTFHAPQSVTLRRDEIHVERVASPETEEDAQNAPA